MKLYRRLLPAIILCVLVGGCAMGQETYRMAMGSSLRTLERLSDTGIAYTFRCERERCVEQAVHDLKEIKAEILRIDTRSYAILSLVERVSEVTSDNIYFPVNRADVGIFFYAESPQTTRVVIVSQSSNIAEYTAEHILHSLERIS